jgi:selenocysteine lyase/cysteine desulfurase
MDGRVSTFALSVDSRSPRDAAERLGERGFAVWHGNYYAVEVMKRLGLPDGAVRVGIVHYNTADEVDRLLSALESVAGHAVGDGDGLEP